jgi:hypothetical protein
MLTDYDRSGANGQGLPSSPMPVVPPAPSGPRDKQRIVWLELPEPYEGVRIQAWINPPNHLMTTVSAGGQRATLAALQALPDSADHDAERERLQAQAAEERYAILSRIVLAHNGWEDYDGCPYPPANTREFWDAISTEAAMLIFAVLTDEATKAPLAFQKRRR